MASFSGKALQSIALLVLVLFTCKSESKLVKHRFEVKYFSGSPDGVYKNKILGINGKFPGPTIEAEIGDQLEIEVVNSIQDKQPTTIHWHGIHHKGTCFEDGTSQISQCPLKYGNSQMYLFNVTQTGTYWYHSHVNSQYTEGMWGALIIKNHEENYQYDEEMVIAVNDWYHQTAHENEEWHLSPPSLGVPPYPNSGLINGHGRSNCYYAALEERSCSAANQRRSVFKVAPGKTFRVRVINTSAVAAFNFSIDGHILQTIEVDGVEVATPIAAEVATIAAAQRYSFLVTTDKPIDRYLIRADLRVESLMLIEGVNINKYPEALIGDVTAVLEYDPKLSNQNRLLEETTELHSYLDVVPASNRTSPMYLDENKLTPYDRIPAPSHVDQEILLVADFYEDHEDIRRGSFNRTPFVLPHDKPLLFTLIDGEPLPETAFAIEIGYMNVIQVVINNPFYGPHPFHLHGHHFWVMGTGGWFDGDYIPGVHELNPNGAKRDTVVVQEQSWAVIRFVADNPGLWTFHCHIDWHNLSGMAMTFLEAPEVFRNTTNKLPEDSLRLCSDKIGL